MVHFNQGAWTVWGIDFGTAISVQKKFVWLMERCMRKVSAITRSVCVQIELDRKTSGAVGELVYFMDALFILL